MTIYFISPTGKSNPTLFPTMIKTLKEQGHTITNNINEATVIFFDLYSMVGTYDSEIMSCLSFKIPIIYFDESDYGGCQDGTENWFGFNQLESGNYAKNAYALSLTNCKVVYFMRKMDKTKTFPDHVFPYEVPYSKDHDFTPVTKEQLFKREFDLCFIGNNSPTRLIFFAALGDNFKIDVRLGMPKLEHYEWLERHRQSKMFVEVCGGGWGSERPQQLFSIAPMLRVKSNKLIMFDFEDCNECLEVNEIPTQEDINKIKIFLSDSEMLYHIYNKGIEKTKQYFSEEFRTNYILSILKQEGIQ